jgi:myo-inositol-1(or 4)-monophosphatase
VSIGHVKDGEVLHGAAFLPDLGELYIAQKGEGAFLNGNRINQISPGEVKPNELISIASAMWKRRRELPGNPRTIGSVVLEGVWVTSGKLRGIIGLREALYDVAAEVLIAKECGADVRYADGSEFLISELLDGKKIPKPWVIFPPESGFILPEPGA